MFISTAFWFSHIAMLKKNLNSLSPRQHSQWPQFTYLCTYISYLRFCLHMLRGPMTLNHFSVLRLFFVHFFVALLWCLVYSALLALSLCPVLLRSIFNFMPIFEIKKTYFTLHICYTCVFRWFPVLLTTVQPFAHKNYFKIETKKENSRCCVVAFEKQERNSQCQKSTKMKRTSKSISDKLSPWRKFYA